MLIIKTPRHWNSKQMVITAIYHTVYNKRVITTDLILQHALGFDSKLAGNFAKCHLKTEQAWHFMSVKTC